MRCGLCMCNGGEHTQKSIKKDTKHKQFTWCLCAVLDTVYKASES